MKFFAGIFEVCCVVALAFAIVTLMSAAKNEEDLVKQEMKRSQEILDVSVGTPASVSSP